MGMVYVGSQTNRPDLGEAFRESLVNPADAIALQVLPAIEVATRADNYPLEDREDMLRIEKGVRAAGANFNRLNVRLSEDEYSCQPFGLEVGLPVSVMAEFSKVLSTEELAVRRLQNNFLLKMDQLVAALFFNTTTWTGASLFTDRSAAPWATAATDIIAHVLAAKEKVRQNTGMQANALVIGAGLLPALLSNTGVKAAAGLSADAPLTLRSIQDRLPSIFGLERLVVGGLVRNAALEGLAFSGSDIWGDTYASVARLASPGGDITESCVGRTFVWTGEGSGADDMDVYYENQTKTQVYQKEMFWHNKIIAPEFAHLMDVKA